jgi:tRNA(Ile)-lysidine synthase
VQALAEQLLKAIRRQDSIHAGDRVAVAVSGGADSVALLHLLLELRAELGIVLSVAHVNHQLRGEESEQDAGFVARLARQHELTLHACVTALDLNSKHPSDKAIGIEAAARRVRYDFFRKLAREGRASKIVTAHTLDDQAETVLLRIFRGTGIRGLAGIHPRIVFEDQGGAFGEVVRPLLGFRRAELLEFLRARGQSWREDSSNRDIAFLRNRVRHRLLPRIAEEFGEAAIEHMSELAEIARAEEEHWAGADAAQPRPAASLPLTPLLALSLAAQRRMIREWLKANAPDSALSFRLIEDVLELARGSAGRGSDRKKLELPAGAYLQRGQHELSIDREPLNLDEDKHADAFDYEYALPVPGMVEVPELKACVEALVVNIDSVPNEVRGQLLDMDRLSKEIVIRNWRPGDRFWPAHTSVEKKVKELLSDRHVTGAEKKLWPVAIAEGCGIIWMRGFSVPAAFQTNPEAAKAIWIREIACMM